nr:phage portal protein [uncultured Allomuricauda sp.]
MLNGLRRGLASFISPDKDLNKYLQAFLQPIGGQWTQYDTDRRTYVEKGILHNPDVYSILKQQQDKAASIPWKVVEGDDEIEKDFPLKRPNPLQTWPEVKALQKMFLRSMGEIILYTPSPEGGLNKGQPSALYVLPVHLMKIVLKDNIDLKDFDENPIKSWMLVEGNSFTEFEAENIIHIKYPNPDFDLQGSHLYGLSPLRPLLRNIQSSNTAIDNNNKTLLNSGAFGLIHGKGATMTQEQATALKARLKEMDSSPERLGKIAGVSAEIGFTRLALTTDELKPFEYLKFDQKQLCNALGWSDKLLNNDDGGKYDNVNQFRKQVITDNIMPDNRIIDEAYTNQFIRRFKGYENAELISVYDELPELQEDLTVLTERVVKSVDVGLISRAQGLKILGWEDLIDEEDLLKVRTVVNDVIPLEEALDEDFSRNDPKTVS